jgi:hypothetical protein
VFLGVALSALVGLFGCSGSEDAGCKAGQQTGLFLSVSPSSVVADGVSSINIRATGLDADCAPLPADTVVLFSLSNQSPTTAGQFSNGETNHNVTMGTIGASTKLMSSVEGTASVNALVTGGGPAASPVNVSFVNSVTGKCSLQLGVNPAAIQGDGASTSTLTATVSDNEGKLASDVKVDFTATEGSLSADSANTDSSGVAQVTLTSSVVTKAVSSTVVASFVCNDAGSSKKTDQATVQFVLGNDPFILLTASTEQVLADGVSTVALTATLYKNPAELAGAGETVTFTTDMGTFTSSNNATKTTTTDEDGEASATFLGGTTSGVATLKASASVDSVTVERTVQISIKQLGHFEFLGASPTKLGIRGSGRNETSVLSFKVKDTEGNPFSDLRVDFSISHASAGDVSLDPHWATTDANGEVRTVLHSGRSVNSVTVKAESSVGTVTLSAESAALVIVGAKPSFGPMTFSCKRHNITGFLCDNVHTKCTISLADRYGNKVGFATQVAFLIEAGHIDPSVETEDDGVNMGSAEVDMRTGNPRPKDVPPAPTEPKVVGSTYTNNPRDGLVTIIAYTSGEEDFTDANGNGEWDTDEPFVDLGEPFLDENDDNVRDDNERFVDVNENQKYDGPNGQWDSDTVIWRPHWVVWTGNILQSHSGLSPHTAFLIKQNQTYPMTWVGMDTNLNPLNDSTKVSIKVEGKGSLAGGANPPFPYSYPDSIGTYIQFIKLNASDTPCQGTDKICYWKSRISGYALIGGHFSLLGSASPITPSEYGAVTLTFSYDDDCGNSYSWPDTVVGQFGDP